MSASVSAIHEDDARAIRLFAIERVRAGMKQEDLENAQCWLGVAILAGASREDLCVALELSPEFGSEGFLRARRAAGEG